MLVWACMVGMVVVSACLVRICIVVVNSNNNNVGVGCVGCV
jgi:hypothetical protein